MDYSKILDSLNRRYNPESLTTVETRMMSESAAFDKEVSKYIFSAMTEVDSAYTKRIKDAGAAVKSYLTQVNPVLDFDYQGSVMTGTHIRGVSDIDLLVFCTKFEGTDIDKVQEALKNRLSYSQNELQRLQAFNNSFCRYQGDSVSDLMTLRLQCEKDLGKQYTIIDTTNPKSIKLTNQHYHRDVDVVVAAKHKSIDYVLKGGLTDYLGVCIFNKEKLSQEKPDYPFLSISRINQRSSETNGRLKRLIRFLKNVNVDMEIQNPLKSFDINAICYNIPADKYMNATYPDLVSVVWQQIHHLLLEESYKKLKSVVGDEWVFLGKPDKVRALNDLENAVWKIYCDLNSKII